MGRVSEAVSMSGQSPADAAIASVEEQFAAMYRNMKAAMRRRAYQVHPELQVMGYAVLTTVHRCGPTHAGVLAEVLGMDKSLLSRQLRVLEELGLLEREVDPDDKRISILTLSQIGQDRINAVRVTDRAALYDQLRDWDVGDLDKLAELLSRVNGTAR